MFVCCPRDGLVSPLDEGKLADDRASCGLQGGLSSTCVLYSTCSPFLELMANLVKPLPVSVSSVVTSSFLCGVTEDERGRYPNICCPTAALQQGIEAQEPDKPPEEKPKRHKYLKFDCKMSYGEYHKHYQRGKSVRVRVAEGPAPTAPARPEEDPWG